MVRQGGGAAIPRLTGVALALACALVALASPPARGGTYTVYSCQTPSGAAASTADWTWSRKRVSAGTLTKACPSGGLTLQLTPHAVHPSDDDITIVYRAPADTEIRGYSIWRSARLGPRYNYWRWDLGVGVAEKCHSTDGTCSSVGSAAAPLSSGNLIRTSDRSGVTGVQMRLTCGEDDTKSTSCVAANPAGVLTIHRADFTLFDGYAPRFERPPSGPLVDAHTDLVGVQHVWISASDRGGGVYRAMLEVDGQVVASSVLDGYGGRCQEPFTRAQPCAPAASGTLALDTARLADGGHTLRIVVTDATGTNSAEWGPVRFSTANASCNPRPRIDAMRLSAGLVARGGGSAATVLRGAVRRQPGQPSRVRGRLVSPLGVPVAGARVCVAAREQREGAGLKTHGSAVTDHDGRFELGVPGGPSREVYVVHRVANGAVVAKVRVEVKARVSLAPSRSRLRNGQRVMLRGRLRHGPMPRRGVLVELQAQRGSKWQTFGTTRTRPDGRYRFAYRFSRTTSLQRYRMRALVAEQANYPYARGASRPIALLVGP